MSMSGFICHDDYLAKTSKLTDEEVGRLFRALMKYHASGIADDLDGRESIAFDFIREDIDRTDAAYKAKCEKNRNNRMQAINDCQRPLTNVDDPSQKEKEKEKEINKEDKEKKEKKAERDARFNCFWKAYPRKEAKQAAQKAFEKLAPDNAQLEVMLSALNKQKVSEQWTKDGGQFIPHPATWINQRRWEDEPLAPAPQVPRKVVQEQVYEQRANTENTAADVPDWFKEYLTS